MAERRLRIDRLIVRLRGVTEPQARGIVAGLGEAVLRQLSESPTLGVQRAGAQHIERIDAGSIALSNRDRLATHLTDAVSAHLPLQKGDR